MRQIHKRAAVAASAFVAAAVAAVAAPVAATALSPAADSRWTRVAADGLMNHELSWGAISSLMNHDLSWHSAGPVVAHMMKWDIDWTPGLLTDGTNWDSILPADMHYYNNFINDLHWG
ncbi:hypothetical protein [Symbioplanes lichenis]|uniref:hypothetical protein n=1 Tax=Symbioplanes lichenis TaxID=1629072 RepID=UPI00273A5717|nr:hypothetical protein [Actinoplanes lichenis]